MSEKIKKLPPKKLSLHKPKSFGLVKYIFFIAVVSLLSFVAGYKASGKELPTKISPAINSSEIANKSNANGLDFARFWEVWDTLNKTYYDKTKIDSNKMLEGAISGMVRSLGDPYTSYLPKEDNQAINEDLDGSFTLPEAVKKIRGKSGTKVSLKLLSDGEIVAKDVDLLRATINIPSLVLSFKDGYGIIKINKFGEKTNSEWDKAVGQVLAQKSKGLIVDVRNNPGGYLNSAVYLGSEFTNGTVVIQEGTDGVRKNYDSERTGKLIGLPVVVLVNEGSASASEILAGAIKVQAKGSLVGQKSFGKGTIQEVQDFENGAGLHVTIAKWLLPNGEWINGKGITPDYEVEMTTEDLKAEKDPQLDKALEVIKSK